MAKNNRVEIKRAAEEWKKFILDLKDASPIDIYETEEDKAKRIKRLEANDEEWFKYYFANYYKCEPAPFHKRSTRRVMNNAEWYEVRAWSRECAKSARTMMEVIKLGLTGKKKNIILTSNSADNAERLLQPWKLTLEHNQRIINDYGEQQTLGSWTSKHFITKTGVSFLAIGAGQSPRGTRNKDERPDVIIVDDFDTDEECRNPDIIDKKWKWFEQALYATRSISNGMLVIFCGNIIADDTCITRAMKMADKYEIINIRDKDGKSTWLAKNTEARIDRTLSKISWASQQKEYFNTPVTEGKIFNKLHYGKIKPLKQYKFLVVYTDPSYKRKGDYKASCLIGKWKDEYHVIDMFCRQTTTAIMLDWYYYIEKEYGGKVPIYYYIEYPWIDEPLIIEIKAANKRHGFSINPKPDERKKPDKYYRIETNLEPINRNGKLIFNEKLKGTDDMDATQGQFLAISPKSRVNDDAPDCVEGGKFIVDIKTVNNTNLIEVHSFSRGSTRKHF